MTDRTVARRTAIVVVAAALLAAPAVVLRVLCVGRACDRAAPAGAEVPFCSLDDELRRRLVAGYRDGRGPDVLAVTGPVPVVGSDGLRRTHLDPPWPSAADPRRARVPIVFAGTGVRAGGSVPPGTGLDDVAPTVAEIIGLDRPHPSVRSGRAVEDVARGPRPRLAVTVIWKGVDAADLRRSPRAWPVLRRLLADGAGTLAGDPGSLPLDPAALVATVGTGGLPSQHGITGTLLRNDRGRLVRAWGPGSPFSVIAALGDHLDRRFRQRPRIGVVGTDVTDRGAIGGTWYVGGDRDDVVIEPGGAAAQAAEASGVLASGYGRDAMPDLLVVAMDDALPRMDAALGRIVRDAGRASRGSAAVVLTSTGSSGPARDAVPHGEVARDVERRTEVGGLVEATAVGGLFIDEERLGRASASQDEVLAAMRAARGPRGAPLLADAFSGLAVSLARYC
ncbi:MAG TPA: hypothetical protein VHL78_07415 [Actinomycetota bacterium]|nr:hypothetical protein [Actinomycetota bacterium]